MSFKLRAQVSRSDVRTIQEALDQLTAKDSAKEMAQGCVIEAELEGASAWELNRTLPSALRKVQRKTTLRSVFQRRRYPKSQNPLRLQ
jgi:hypothetical protein